MKRLHGTVSGALTAGLIGFLSLGHPAFAEQVSRQQILEALTVHPKATSFSDRLRLTRSMTFNDRDYVVASTQSKPATIDLGINFDFNSAAITSKAEPQLDELGAALSDPQLRGATISINGHTTASAAMPLTINCQSAAPR
jgi:outer membrane protein OmpA-like peptidoglycan-associated protein